VQLSLRKPEGGELIWVWTEAPLYRGQTSCGGILAPSQQRRRPPVHPRRAAPPDYAASAEGRVHESERREAAWSCCSLTGAPLQEPVVACRLGKL